MCTSCRTCDWTKILVAHRISWAQVLQVHHLCIRFGSSYLDRKIIYIVVSASSKPRTIFLSKRTRVYIGWETLFHSLAKIDMFILNILVIWSTLQISVVLSISRYWIMLFYICWFSKMKLSICRLIFLVEVNGFYKNSFFVSVIGHMYIISFYKYSLFYQGDFSHFIIVF